MRGRQLEERSEMAREEIMKTPRRPSVDGELSHYVGSFP